MPFSPEQHLDIFLRSHRTIAVRWTQKFAEGRAVPPSEARVLTLLSRTEDHRMRIEELAQELGMTKGAASRIVDRLVKSDYVERQDSDADRRVVYASMTLEGLEALKHASRVFRDAFREIFLGGLSEDELNQMSALLVKLDRANDSAKRAFLASDESEGANIPPPLSFPN
jgi:DNA-binding MarR family transcriptional regulator